MPELSENLVRGRRCVVESVETHVFATIPEAEFEEFQARIKDLAAWPSYDDFMLERDGSFLGLSWAGVNAVQIDVSYRPFARWVELTGAPCNLETLDDFAMRRWLRANYPNWEARPVRATPASNIQDQSGHLYIPIYPVARPQKGAESDSVHTRLILSECLNPTG